MNSTDEFVNDTYNIDDTSKMTFINDEVLFIPWKYNKGDAINYSFGNDSELKITFDDDYLEKFIFSSKVIKNLLKKDKLYVSHYKIDDTWYNGNHQISDNNVVDMCTVYLDTCICKIKEIKKDGCICMIPNNYYKDFFDQFKENDLDEHYNVYIDSKFVLNKDKKGNYTNFKWINFYIGFDVVQ